MSARVLRLCLIASALAVAACTEAPQAPATAPTQSATMRPSLARGGNGGSVTCNFNAVNKSVSRYFGGTEAKAVKDTVALMQAAGVGTSAAQDYGFDIFVHVSNNVLAGNTDAQDGSTLVNGLLACMYTSAGDLPLNFPEDFTVALTPAAHGAFEVRGGATDAAGPVYSRPASAAFSGIEPGGGNTWAQMLAGDPAPGRILFYGRPGGSSQTYDWKVAPRSATFAAPGAVVAVCIDATANTADLLHEENVGLLTFVDAAFLDPAWCSPTVATRSLPARLASRLAHWASGLLATPAWANPGGLGGSTGGIHSEFGPQTVDTAATAFVGQPSNVPVGQIIAPPVQVLVTAQGSTTPIPNAQVTLVAVDNNGVTAVLSGTLTQTTDVNGIATFPDLSESKTGAYRLVVASGAVINRPGIAIAPSTSAKFNVSP